MKKLIGSLAASIFLIMTHSAQAEKKTSVIFTNLKHGQTVGTTVEVCMKATGVVIEPASNGVNAGRGHLHILVDYPLPPNLKQPLSFDLPENIIHLGDGSNCRTLSLTPGRHSLRALIADGSHTPLSPPVTKLIDVRVK